jgi:hypothetical protein
MDSDDEFLAELLCCHRAAGADGGDGAAGAAGANAASAEASVEDRVQPVATAAHDRIPDDEHEWLSELFFVSGKALAGHAADMEDHEWIRDLCWSQTSSGSKSDCANVAIGAHVAAGAVAIGAHVAIGAQVAQEATKDARAVQGMWVNPRRPLVPLVVDKGRWRDFGEVAEYMEPKGEKMFAREVPPQDSIVFSGMMSFGEGSLKPVEHLKPFDHAVMRLMMWKYLFGVIVFKIGIAADPTHRFRNPEFGYTKERVWHLMDVVLAGPANLCRVLEMQLISAMGLVQGCYNLKPGGEGVGKDQTYRCCVYLVVAEAGHGMAVSVAWTKRRKLLAGVAPVEPV